MANKIKASRLVELDSLRGLAALTVFISHCMIMLPLFEDWKKLPKWVEILKFTPLRFFWAGGEAVFLFFVLSGFVLSLQFFSSNSTRYTPYIIKRVFRLYIPYLCAVTLAVIAEYFFSRHGIKQLSSWFNLQWTTPLTSGLIIHHLWMVGNYNTFAFDSPIWSLVQEMRISIIFPLIMVLVVRCNWKTSIVLSLAISFVPYRLNHFITNSDIVNYAFTLRYVPMFMLGALLAKHRYYVSDFYKQTGVSSRILLFVVGISLFTYPMLFPYTSELHKPEFNNWGVTFGAAVFMIFALASPVASRILQVSALQFLGKISYSFYLYHVIALLTVTSLLFGKAPLLVIWSFSLTGSLLISSLSYYFIEVPSIQWGRNLAKTWSHLRTLQPVSVNGLDHDAAGNTVVGDGNPVSR